jgi:hypothetical protein
MCVCPLAVRLLVDGRDTAASLTGTYQLPNAKLTHRCRGETPWNSGCRSFRTHIPHPFGFDPYIFPKRIFEHRHVKSR